MGGDLLYGLFSPECYTTFFHTRDFLHVACLKLLLSKVLSYGILAGAMFVKVPQIVNIVRAKSTQGLSPAMYLLENVAYLVTVAYNARHAYPFSTYGESVFLLAQGAVLVFLLGLYNGRLGLVTLVGVAFAAAAAFLFQVASLDQLALFQTGTIVVFAASRLPQIIQNFRSKSTGVLSAVTVAMNFAGTSARIFTTLQEVKDSVVLVSYLSSWCLNATLLAQVLLYWNNRGKTTAAAAKKKSRKAQ